LEEVKKERDTKGNKEVELASVNNVVRGGGEGAKPTKVF
jgi:hypothetical protein